MCKSWKIIAWISLFQQEHVISELQEYTSGLPASQKALSQSTKLTVDYLKACNKIFERGILGKEVFINDVSSPIVVNMEEGFQFFTTWLDEKLAQGVLHKVSSIGYCLNPRLYNVLETWGMLHNHRGQSLTWLCNILKIPYYAYRTQKMFW